MTTLLTGPDSDSTDAEFEVRSVILIITQSAGEPHQIGSPAIAHTFGPCGRIATVVGLLATMAIGVEMQPNLDRQRVR